MSAPSGTPTRGEPLHLQIARTLRNNIEAGVLRDGEVLPSTRELAEQWGVSVFTITEAMKQLVTEGLVESKSRSKRVVRFAATSVRDVRPDHLSLTLIGGYAGSGKTELGRVLARETRWAMLDKDTLTRPVVEYALEAVGLSPHDRESERYQTLVRPREYESLLAAVNENVRSGNSVIATAPFLREFSDPAWLERIGATYGELGAHVTLVWVATDLATMHTYIRHRGAARDAAKLADWDAYARTVDVDFRPPAPHLVVENSASSRPLQAQARSLVTSILAAASA